MEIELLIYLIALILTIAGMWKCFQKAGERGWTSIIPVYNLFVLVRIIKKPWYWALLMLIPYIGVIWSVWSMNLFSKSFGKDLGYTIGLIFFPFIFYPLLGYGAAEYTELVVSEEESEDNIIDAEVVEEE
jgi:hypothetical protein